MIDQAIPDPNITAVSTTPSKIDFGDTVPLYPKAVKNPIKAVVAKYPSACLRLTFILYTYSINQS